VPDVIGLCASTGALKLDPPLDKRTRMKHMIDTVRASLLMVGRKELIELTLPIRKRVSPLATLAQFGLVLGVSSTYQIALRKVPNEYDLDFST
jgi:hypothetical protein